MKQKGKQGKALLRRKMGPTTTGAALVALKMETSTAVTPRV